MSAQQLLVREMLLRILCYLGAWIDRFEEADTEPASASPSFSEKGEKWEPSTLWHITAYREALVNRAWSKIEKSKWSEDWKNMEKWYIQPERSETEGHNRIKNKI